MKGTDIQRIEHYLENGDPYTFILLAVDNPNLLKKRNKNQNADVVVKDFLHITKSTFSSGTIITRYEEDRYVAFAPFILDKRYLMNSFEHIQQEYFEFSRKYFPEADFSVSIGCVVGMKQTELKTLYRKAEKLTCVTGTQGRYGYKIMEE